MKKFFYAMAALLLMTPLALVSCGDDDDDDGKKSTLAPVTLKTPAYKQDAMKIELKNPTEVGNMKIHAIELTESGNYIVSFRPVSVAATRGSVPLSYLIGQFVKNGGTIRLDNITISLDSGTATANVTIAIGGEEVTVPVTLTKVQAEDLMTTYLCRTWTITNTRLRYPSGTATLAKDFTGCNLHEIIEFARKYVNISDEVSVNKIVKGVTFTSAKTFLINYADNTNDVGSWQWSGTPSVELQSGGLTYRWNDSDMGNSFMNGSASVEFSASECKLSLKANIDGSNVEVVWTMK